MSKLKEGAKPHSLLAYMINKAVLQGQETKHEINLSLSDLQNEFEDLDLNDKRHNLEVNNIILKVKIETTWDTSLELESEEELMGVTDDEEDSDGGPSDSNQGSH